MKTLSRSILAGVASIALSGPASATVMETFSFADVLSYNLLGEAAHDTRSHTSNGGGFSGGYTLDSIGFSGSAYGYDSFLLFLQDRSEMAVGISIDAGAAVNKVLGSGGGDLSIDPSNPELFTGSFTLSGPPILTNGTVLSFIFNELVDTWALDMGAEPTPPGEFDAKWSNITFTLNGTGIDFCTLHPNDPSCLHPAPEPATLALLGLGLAGLGLMRRRAR